ncbi:DWNN-domain-containing protein [Parathielavia appendiculata]|uniref:DWNN-domain-containing protein n=1 Tax=Parathielavia appendiculata TaxID=2587402 RepID=A0AAN6Z7X7_9PEZI|nr:DWNN-domain-containing protein [Parathielavia appendiculata]
MASSVFFKFKSQKEPTRVGFDGTGISVFELKREIILRSGLGDGTDFDLVICADEGMKEVYDDDTTIIPRSTTVIARRMPPKIPGRGGAARYVSGKMPVHAKNSSRREQIVKPVAKTQSNTLAQLSSAMTEEEKMAAVFQAQTENFTAREEEMATQQYVAKGGPKKPANVPDHDPPQGYICYRCGEKGHWIQLCPTNDNPEYDNRPRVKRTTGIPRSFLKTVDKATALGQNSDGDDSKTPSGIMVNADGEFVIAEPDKASWEQFQAKAKVNPSAAKAAAEEDKEVRERGLECPVDKKMFIEPMKTPCCEKTYCNDCITNALIESDFVCPACKSDGVLIDDLKPDKEAVKKIEAYLGEKDGRTKEEFKIPESPAAAKPQEAADGNGEDRKADAKQAKSKSPSPLPTAPATTQPGQTSTPTLRSASSTPAGGEQAQPSKKRPAEDALENPKIPKAPKAMQKAQEAQQQNMMPMMGGIPMMYPGMPMMPGNYMPPMGGLPNMNMGMMNPMINPMMAGYSGINNMAGPGGFNGTWAGPGGPGNMMGGGGPMNGMGMGMEMGLGTGTGTGTGGGYGHQQQQHQQQFHGQQQQYFGQHKNFSYQAASGGGEEDDAYFRKPVNPHRHQNRQRRVRPSDYREL